MAEENKENETTNENENVVRKTISIKEVTDSIFRVNNKFIQAVNPDYIEKYWLPLHTDIYNYIEEHKNMYDAVISDVESTFFYKDQKN